MILSILICTLEERHEQFKRLVDFLKLQPGFGTHFNIFACCDNRERTTGAKRQELLESADGNYVAFVDDDDEVTKSYIPAVLEACKKGPDAVGLNGWMTTNGSRRQEWSISKDHPYKTTHNGTTTLHLRFNNHLSPVNRRIALQIGFKDITYGEDYDYAVRLKESGLIKTEVFILNKIYHYRYKTNK